MRLSPSFLLLLVTATSNEESLTAFLRETATVSREALPILGTPAFDVCFLEIVGKGKIDERDLIPVFAQAKLTPEQNKRFNAVLKRYPKEHQLTARQFVAKFF